MILHQFPDLAWLRKQASTSFSNQKAVDDKILSQKGWPSVVMNTASYGTERHDIRAPFSLFMNISGKSFVKAEGKEVQLDTNTFCLVNQGEHYDLLIPSTQKGTETFNIHFGDQLFSEVVYALSRTEGSLLDNPDAEKRAGVELMMRTRWLDVEMKKEVNELKYFFEITKGDDIVQESILLASFLEKLLLKGHQEWKALRHIGSLKKSTKVELMGRLLKATDFIHQHFNQVLSIDELSVVACMSKYHFLRSFKQAFLCTPHQYIMRLRLQKAEELLRYTSLEIREIALKIGFQEPNSFTKFFAKYHHQPPLSFRMNN